MTAANRQLAADFRRQAAEASARRRTLLVAAVALAESTSIAGAVRILREWNGPAAVRGAAIELLTENVPAVRAGQQEGRS